MQAMLRNSWLLLAGMAGWGVRLWIKAQEEHFNAISYQQRALSLVGLAIAVLAAALYFLWSARGQSFAQWLLPPQWRAEHVARHIARHARLDEGFAARLSLRVAAVALCASGLLSLSVNLTKNAIESVPLALYSTRREEEIERATLRLRMDNLRETLPQGMSRVALLLARTDSDEIDLTDGAILAHEFFPIRFERYLLNDCLETLPQNLAERFDAVIYQCDREGAYHWRKNAAPEGSNP